MCNVVFYYFQGIHSFSIILKIHAVTVTIVRDWGCDMLYYQKFFLINIQGKDRESVRCPYFTNEEIEI